MLLLGPGLAYLYGTFGCTVGKLVGQYSDSDRVSRSLQTPSRESKKLKHYQSRGGERENLAGEQWCGGVRAQHP